MSSSKQGRFILMVVNPLAALKAAQLASKVGSVGSKLFSSAKVAGPQLMQLLQNVSPEDRELVTGLIRNKLASKNCPPCNVPMYQGMQYPGPQYPYQYPQYPPQYPPPHMMYPQMPQAMPVFGGGAGSWTDWGRKFLNPEMLLYLLLFILCLSTMMTLFILQSMINRTELGLQYHRAIRWCLGCDDNNYNESTADDAYF